MVWTLLGGYCSSLVKRAQGLCLGWYQWTGEGVRNRGGVISVTLLLIGGGVLKESSKVTLS